MKENKQSLRLRQKTIVLTGGHAGATGYATIQALRKNTKFNWRIYWIGAASAIEGTKSPTLEESFLPKIGVEFLSITTGRVQIRFTKHTIPSLLKMPLGFIQAFLILNKVKPDITLSFGGFAAFPVVVVSSLLGIPVIIHEQTSAYGRANKLSQRFATKITLARPESLIYFDNKKSVVIGNPVSEEILDIKPKMRLGTPPTIFITGGSRGSEMINQTIKKVLPGLTSKYKIIHQVGLNNLKKYKDNKNYEVYGMIPPSEWYKFIDKADLIISRAGANMVSEIIAAKRQAILIPIPWSFMDEQSKNAAYARNFGIASIIPQDSLTGTKLLQKIQKSFKDWDAVNGKIANIQSVDRKASKTLADILVNCLR